MQRIVSRLVLYPPLSVSMIESGVAILYIFARNIRSSRQKRFFPS